MSFESYGSDVGLRKSPGGFEFGIQGWSYSDPVPKSITFFLDNTCIICDQYGRNIRRALTADGQEIRFADCSPDANREGDVYPRPQFATHMQTLDALAAEGIDWLAREVRYIDRTGQAKSRSKLKLDEAIKLQVRLNQEGNRDVTIIRTIACAGWPQLPYEELKKLTELPPTPYDELRKIRDKKLRADALRIKREAEAAARKDNGDEDD